MPVEFPRVDDRTVGKTDRGKFRRSWMTAVTLPEQTEGPPDASFRVGMNTLLQHDNVTGKTEKYFVCVSSIGFRTVASPELTLSVRPSS